MGQNGWLKVEKRKSGKVWVFCFRKNRASDGKRVEQSRVVGSLTDFPNEFSAWKQVEHLKLQIRAIGSNLTFEKMAEHYISNELQMRSPSKQKADSTVEDRTRIIRKRLVPRFKEDHPTLIQPLEIEQWLDTLAHSEGLGNPTLAKYRGVLMLIYKHGQRHGLIPRTPDANPVLYVHQQTTSDYEALVLEPQETFQILTHMRQPEKTLTLLIAATGLRISECVALRWSDIDWLKKQIRVTRGWVRGKLGRAKSRASRKPVALHPILSWFLAEWRSQTPFHQDSDWIFASSRLAGEKPRSANMLVEDHLKPAALAAGILRQDEEANWFDVRNGQPVNRFGFHNLRHSLASFLVDAKCDPKTVQDMLRHADVKMTLGLYSHSKMERHVEAQGMMLEHMGIRAEKVN